MPNTTAPTFTEGGLGFSVAKVENWKESASLTMFNAVFPKKTCIRSPWGNRDFGVAPPTPLNLTLWGQDAKMYILRTLPGNCYVY